MTMIIETLCKHKDFAHLDLALNSAQLYKVDQLSDVAGWLCTWESWGTATDRDEHVGFVTTRGELLWYHSIRARD